MRTGERMKGNDDRSPSIRCRPGFESSGARAADAHLALGRGDGGDRGARRRTIFAWQRGQRDDAVAAVTFQPDTALERVATLTDWVDTLRDELKGSGAANSLRRELHATRAELESMLWPALPDGWHVGRAWRWADAGAATAHHRCGAAVHGR